MTYGLVDVNSAREMIAYKAQVVDIRDQMSYDASHIETAVHINNQSIHDFLQKADRKRPLIVYCYHGNSSKSAAAFFAEQGFEKTYSLEGGFEAWSASETAK